MDDTRIIRLQAAIAAPTEGLPPLPADPRNLGRHVSWAVILQAPGFHFGDEEIEVDAAYIDGRIEAFEQLVAKKGPEWLPPILTAHEDTGIRDGDVVAMERVTLDGQDTLLAALVWADPDAAMQIESGRLTHVSVGLHTIQLEDTGEVLEDVPLEVSRTTMPHLGVARILNTAHHGGPMADTEVSTDLTAGDEERPDLAAFVVSLQAENADLKTKLEAALAPPEADEEDDEEEEDATEATALEVELTARVKELETANATREQKAFATSFVDAYGKGSLTLTADLAAFLVGHAYKDDALGKVIDAAYNADPKHEDTVSAIVSLPDYLAKRLSSNTAAEPAMSVPQSLKDCDRIAMRLCAKNEDGSIDLADRNRIYGEQLAAMEARQ